MGKKKNKKNKNGAESMDITNDNVTNSSGVQAMDTSESGSMKANLNVGNRNMKKSAPKRRGQNVRKAKAIEKALSNSDKIQEKISKNETKEHRVNNLKSLY